MTEEEEGVEREKSGPNCSRVADASGWFIRNIYRQRVEEYMDKSKV